MAFQEVSYYSGLTPAKRPSEGREGETKRARYSSLGTDDEIQRNVREDHLAKRLLSSDLGNDTGSTPCPLPFLSPVSITSVFNFLIRSPELRTP